VCVCVCVHVSDVCACVCMCVHVLFKDMRAFEYVMYTACCTNIIILYVWFVTQKVRNTKGDVCIYDIHCGRISRTYFLCLLCVYGMSSESECVLSNRILVTGTNA